MKGLILMHMDNEGVGLAGGPCFEKAVEGLVQTTLDEGGNAYTFPPYWGGPARFIQSLDGKLITIDYRTPRVMSMQFYDGKQKMVQDGVDEADICGWNRDVCIAKMVGLMLGENDLNMGHSILQWTQEVYEQVLQTRIPVRTLNEYCLY
ncbi:MAG: hypothetical protein KKC75_07960 [Nanoarchaeota archaeon]|nr:hypothetical protein [Nanoarchaeota archaeon]MBU1005264.1 hypothetical protein [Nanoarchaeota archaeon]MBU1947001.1 hypothetical protein [Nanoarchaeota archaeon]